MIWPDRQVTGDLRPGTTIGHGTLSAGETSTDEYCEFWRSRVKRAIDDKVKIVLFGDNHNYLTNSESVDQGHSERT